MKKDSAHTHTDERRTLGAFYTPDAVVDYMVKQLSVANLSGRILEPSAGDGAIIKGLLRAGIHPDQVTAWDINPAVVTDLSELEVSVSIGDGLARDPQPGAFHAIVGNPPYLNKQSEYLKTNRNWLKAKYREIGAHDTYAMFTWQAFQHLAPGGQLIFLISDTFFSLGVHKKFRQWLLTHTRIDSVTLLPKDTFPGASVNTVILAVTAAPAPDTHTIKVIDARDKGVTRPSKPLLVPQADILATPGMVFVTDAQDRADLALTATLPSMMSVLDGGLGMFTRNNNDYLAVIGDSGTPRSAVRKGQQVIDATKVDGTHWRAYHKRGGETRWFAPIEYAVKWDQRSRAQYTIPQSALAAQQPDGATRVGVAVSGVASRLSARLAEPGAMWESNKVFCLFPKDPAVHPASFILAILNSARYAGLAALMNHTVSLQIRDLRALPLLPFTTQEITDLADLGTQAVAAVKAGQPHQDIQIQIDSLVEQAWQRAKTARQ